MKIIYHIYQPYMVRPIVYKSFTRFSAGLVLALLWDRYINTDAFLSVWEHACFILGAFLFGMAWFHYLRLDGMRIHYPGETDPQSRKQSNHPRRDIVDFVDEKIISFDELEYEEQVVCRFSADFLVGAGFWVLSFISACLN